MKDLQEILEASLLDIDRTFEEGDDIEKEFKEAQKVWELFTKKQKVKKVAKIIDTTYKLHIKSATLAKYLCRGINGLDLSDLEFVDIVFNLDDTLFSREHFIKICVASKRHIKVTAIEIQYDDGGNPSDILTVKEAIKIIKNNIATSKYLQDLETVKSEFMKHVIYIRN
jgi:hypothetical protein